MFLANGTAAASTSSASGEIIGAQINPAGTEVSVTDMTVTWTKCGTETIGGSRLTQYCGVRAEVVAGACPTQMTGQNILWDYGFRLSPGKSSSGARSVSVPAPVSYTVCLYAKFEGSFQGIQDESNRLIATETIPAPPAQPGPPDIDVSMSKGEAMILAKNKLAKKYGKSWKNGKTKSISCRELTTIFNCKATWKYKAKPQSGSVIVSK